MMTSQELAEQMKQDIVADAMVRQVPHTVRAFDQLHEFVDSNCYGGADELFGEMVTESKTDNEHQAKLDAFSAIRDPSIKIVDDWLKAGGIEAALAPHRITIWRPKTMIGLGAPQAFLRDEHPTKGDWHTSAKAYPERSAANAMHGRVSCCSIPSARNPVRAPVRKPACPCLMIQRVTV